MNPACDIKHHHNYLFDLHGVLEREPIFFRSLLKTLRCCGHKVFIASGSMPGKLLLELTKLGYEHNIHYDIRISVPEYLQIKGVVFTFDHKGDPWTDDKTWWSSKGLICKEHNIHFMVDDSIQYKEFLPETTIFTLMK